MAAWPWGRNRTRRAASSERERLNADLLQLGEMLQAVADHRACRLGRWYFGVQERLGHLDSFRAMDAPHQEVHRRAREAAQRWREGRREEARQAVRAMEEASASLLALLDRLEADLSRT